MRTTLQKLYIPTLGGFTPFEYFVILLSVVELVFYTLYINALSVNLFLSISPFVLLLFKKGVSESKIIFYVKKVLLLIITAQITYLYFILFLKNASDTFQGYSSSVILSFMFVFIACAVITFRCNKNYIFKSSFICLSIIAMFFASQLYNIRNNIPNYQIRKALSNAQISDPTSLKIIDGNLAKSIDNYANIDRLSKLEHLVVSTNPINTMYLEGLDSLKTITFESSSDNVIRIIPNLSSLISLEFYGVDIDDIDSIIGCSNIKEIHYSNSNIESFKAELNKHGIKLIKKKI